MRSTAEAHPHRLHALLGLLGLGSLAWLLVRSGPKPQRLSYPCQQAALAQTVGALGYLASLLGLAHILHLVRRQAKPRALTVLGASLSLAFATIGGQTHVAPARAASGPLPGWTSPSAISDVFVIDEVPVPECSLDGGALPTTPPCNSPSYALRDRGVERLITEMESHGTYFYKTAAHPAGIVGANDVVVIKINNQWGGQGDGDGSGRLVTNADAVKGVIWAILQHPDSFTGEVVLAENTQGINDNWNLTPANSQDQDQTYEDVVAAFQGLGYSVSLKSWDPLNEATISGGAVGDAGYPFGEFARDNDEDAYILLEDPAGTGTNELSYPKFTTTGGHAVSMRYGVWNGAGYDSDRLTFINMPVLKRHGMASATIAWKNLVGFQTIADNGDRFGGWDRMHGFFWGYDSVGDTDYGLLGRELARVRAPDLNIVDAIWVATDSNTGGNAVRENVLAASTDPFAVDWYASEYILRNAVGNDDLMGGVSAARGGNFRSATRVNQNAAQAAWPGGAYPYIDLADTYDGDTPSATEQQQMNVFVTADDDGLPALSVANVTIAEGNVGTRNAVFTARLSKASGREVLVDWQTADDTALAGSDYTASSGTLTFPAGAVARIFAVATLGDTADEPSETLRVLLSGEVNATLQTSEARLTITDDDPLPGLRVAGLSVIEGHAGTAEAIATVTLSAASSRDVTVDWATANGTARAPSDYVSASGTLLFPAGDTTRTLSVPVRGDGFVEADEAFKVTLSGAVNALLAAPTGTITIRNDDAAVQFAAAAVSKAEGGTATIAVTRTGALATSVTADFATADGTATAGEDYAASIGTLTFAAGVTSRTLSVPVLADSLGEGNETVALALSNPSAGATLDVRPAAVLTILDDDQRVRLSAASYRVAEAGLATIIVQRAGSTAGGLTVDYMTVAAGDATSGDDFTPRGGTLTFAQGQLARSFTVPTVGDTLDESDETLFVQLTGASLGGTPVPVVAPASAPLTIVDNDSGGVLQFAASGCSLREGGTATISVARTGGLASAVTVDYQTFEGAATQGADFDWAGGTLSFAAGQSQSSFTVTTFSDDAGEGSETLTLEIFNVTGGAVLGGRTAVPLTIVDADAFVQIAVPTYAVNEGGTVAVAFRRVNSTAAGETVSYQVVAETAGGADYGVAAAGTLTFAANQLIRTLPIVALQDELVETPETLRVEITAASIGVGQPAAATVTIRDDDRYPAGEIVFVTEGASFAPVLTLKAAATVLWTWDDGTTSSELNPTKDYGTEARRASRLRVTPWSAVRRINIGYDEGDGGSPEIEHVADQHVSAVYNLNLVAPYLEHWCSSFNDIEALAFDNFVVLDTIECFNSHSLRKVSLRNTPRLHRACFEDCDLQALDLTGSPNLGDLRGAVNAYPGITFAARHNSTWHVCIRDNPQFTNRAMFSNASRFPGIAELFIWNTNQAGALKVHSTSATRWVVILASGNSYTSADFTGALQHPENGGQIDLSSNHLTSVTVAGCTQLSALSLASNPLGTAAIDKVLYELDELGTSGGTADLTNTSPPSAAGLAHRANLLARGWTVQVDEP